MNHYIQTVKTYLATRNKEFIVGVSIIAGGAILIAVIALVAYNSVPKVVYQPVKACDLLTLDDAKDLLGANAINTTSKDPVLSRAGNTASSDCGYADGSSDTETMIVTAISVRSGINDEGVLLNKNEFTANRSGQGMEVVKDLGDGAYYNQKLGQLNILEDRKWMILNYGIGSAPEANTLEKAIELAHKVLTSTATASDS